MKPSRKEFVVGIEKDRKQPGKGRTTKNSRNNWQSRLVEIKEMTQNRGEAYAPHGKAGTN